MIDTHSHIYGGEFSEDIDMVVDRARAAGVEHILLPNINFSTIAPMLDLCRRYEGYMSPMMGLHPTDVDGGFHRQLDAMERMLHEDCSPYVAIGEVGLDFYWDDSFRTEQLDAFRRQVGWAAQYGLPLMIHSRSAQPELLAVMEEWRGRGLSGVFHCFGGNVEEARQLLSFDGFALGIGGVLTYRKSSLPGVLGEIPLDRIVLETDSPYLAPVPFRGKRNESSNVAFVLRQVADIYGMPSEEVERVTNENVYRIFAKLKQRKRA